MNPESNLLSNSEPASYDSLRLYLTGGRTTMDRVSESLLAEFSKEHEITGLPQDKQFEHFAGYITVQRHYAGTLDSADIVTTDAGDTGIDAIAIIVNGSLITDIEELNEQDAKAASLDVIFIFVQAERTSGFDGAKIGTFGFGVLDFFKETPSLKRNAKITEAAEIMTALYSRSSKFKRGNPVCRLYYVTTGKWQGDTTLEARRKSAVTDLEGTNQFRDVDFSPIDANELQKLYRQTKNAISREFYFTTKTTIPEMPGVKEAYLGFMPAAEFIKIVQDEDGEIISGLFYDNVRDWLELNPVNDQIKATLNSSSQRARFILMNNGITIIARNLQPTGNKFLIEDFSIVNGCQTSHVLFMERDNIDASVMVPIRLIGTQDEAIINDIIRATNTQTPVKEEQFFALEEFSKSLELFFQAFPDQHKLYYERRTKQYARLDIEKTRIVLPANMIKAYAAMFLSEPHRTTKNYAALKAKVGTEIYARGHRMEPYYTAAYALYKLEFFFRNGKIDPKYKVARWHILLAARLLANPDAIPRSNANETERYCKIITDKLWDSSQADDLISKAAQAVDNAAAGHFDSDSMRNEPFTTKVLEEVSKLQ